MLKHYYPVDDAVVYFINRVNKTENEAYLNRHISKYPDLKKQLESLLSPSIELEKLLNIRIRSLDRECDFFFGLDRSVSGSSQPLWSAANLLLGYTAGLDETAHGLDELLESRLSLSQESRDKLFLSYLSDLDDTEADKGFELTENTEDIPSLIASSRLNSLTRIKLNELYSNFDEHLKRLLEILRPAVEIIENSGRLYKAEVERQIKRFDEAGGLGAYMSAYHSFELSSSGRHMAHISVLAPHTVNICNGVFDFMDVYVGYAVVELSRLLFFGNGSEHLAAMLKLLSDKTRLEMLKAISARPMYGQELVEMFSVTAPTVSYHMTKLVISGLAESYFDCGKSYFRANTKNLLALEKSFHDFLFHGFLSE